MHAQSVAGLGWIEYPNNHKRIATAANVAIFVGAKKEIKVAIGSKLRDIFLVQVRIYASFSRPVFAYQFAAKLIDFLIQNLQCTAFAKLVFECVVEAKWHSIR